MEITALEQIKYLQALKLIITGYLKAATRVPPG